MSSAPHCLPPSSSLPPVRTLRNASKVIISAALRNLQAIYCPLRLPLTLLKKKSPQFARLADSGYASENEVDDDATDEDALAFLRADDFERNHAVRWLTGLIARADELSLNEEECADIVDEASLILASFTDSEDDESDLALTRDFAFPTSLSVEDIKISLNDAPLSGTDHTDVGLQSWGASIVFSRLMCAAPSRFGLGDLRTHANVIELGAGTGLISLALAKLAPVLPARQLNITATDYHPAVLQNLEANMLMNFPASEEVAPPLRTALLDWSIPPPELEASADMLFAADVVYAPEHARWLRDCATHLLCPHGTFWLVVTVRSHGKFEGIPATAEAAFTELGSSVPVKKGRMLRVLEKESLEKKEGIGRGDETGYMLFRVSWVDV